MPLVFEVLIQEMEQRKSRKALWEFLHDYGKCLINLGILRIKNKQVFSYLGYNLTYLAKNKDFDLRYYLRQALMYKDHDVKKDRRIRPVHCDDPYAI
jgi:hypothetical protein